MATNKEKLNANKQQQKQQMSNYVFSEPAEVCIVSSPEAIISR